MNRFQQLLNDNLPPDLVSRLPADLPDMRTIQARLNGLNQAEISARFSAALAEVDQQKVAEFNQAIAGYARRKGIRVPQTENGANTSDMALALAGMMRGGNGLVMLLSLLRDPRIAAVMVPFIRKLLKA